MDFARYPFDRAQNGDNDYNLFRENNAKYWKIQKNKIAKRGILTDLIDDPDFVEMMNNIFTEDFEKRWSI